MDHLSQLNDLVTAFPAAITRILMGSQKDPSVRFIASLPQKLGALVGSLFFAAMAGQVARSFSQTSGFATVIVVACAFCAQDAIPPLIRFSQFFIKKFFKNYASKFKE
jgi:hypothetical protein